MSLETGSVVSESGASAPLPPHDAVGLALRRLREARGWSLADVSARLKFSARQIEALEGERWEELPKGVSLRGLIRNYGRLLGTDPDALVTALEPQIGAAPAARAPVGAAGADGTRLGRTVYQESDSGGSHGSLGWIIVILAVLGAVVAYAFGQGWLPQEWLSFEWLSRK